MKRDLLIIFGIKLLIGIFLLVEFNFNYPESRIHKGIAVTVADTHTYLLPIENLIDFGTPLFPCRMPGHLLIYGPAYALLGKEWGTAILVLIQFVFCAISTLFIARIAYMLGGGKRAYNAVLLLYSMSTFISVWDFVLSADSFSISLMITAVYMLLTYRESRQKWRMLVFGLAMSGSIFFRQIAVVVLPLLIIHVYRISKEHGWKDSFKAILLGAGIPFVMFTSWTLYNFQNHNKFIPLVLPLHECSGAFTMERMKVAEMLNNWGLDLIHWKP
ncbi:MAG: ArnT family glycosyltransferase, partial [Flavobacteriales bacterium]